MCGRYTVTVDQMILETRFEAQMEMADYQPRFNAAPSQTLPLILHPSPDRIVGGKWGFKPHWAKTKPEIKPQLNARAETAAEKPMFRDAFKSNRCLVLADGCYEWQRTGGAKVPHRMTLADGQPFAMAGLWSEMETTEGEPVITFTILTTSANERMATIHTRMPVILSQPDQEKWLDLTLARDASISLLKPYPSEATRLGAVSPEVNNARHDHPGLILPI